MSVLTGALFSVNARDWFFLSALTMVAGARRDHVMGAPACRDGQVSAVMRAARELGREPVTGQLQQ